MLARQLYTLLLYLLTPLMLVRMAIRGMRNRDYLRRWRERFGFAPTLPVHGALWLHAVSVGEVNAVARLVEYLLTQSPDQALMLTTGTPTHQPRAMSIRRGRRAASHTSATPSHSGHRRGASRWMGNLSRTGGMRKNVSTAARQVRTISLAGTLAILHRPNG